MGDIEHPPGRAEGEAARESVLLRTVSRIADVPAADWDACARGGEPSASPARLSNPFISHAFLQALEDSGSATRETGWLPQHLLLEDQSGTLIACMPCYLKSHSQGEYVFDHGWADAYLRAGGRYYPKLQASVPFTPGHGQAPARPRLRQRARARGAAVAGRRASHRPARRFLVACHLPHARRMAACRRDGFAPAHRPAIPLAERELSELRRFPRRASPRASARRSAKNAARRSTAGSRSNG